MKLLENSTKELHTLTDINPQSSYIESEKNPKDPIEDAFNHLRSLLTFQTSLKKSSRHLSDIGDADQPSNPKSNQDFSPLSSHRKKSPEVIRNISNNSEKSIKERNKSARSKKRIEGVQNQTEVVSSVRYRGNWNAASEIGSLLNSSLHHHRKSETPASISQTTPSRSRSKDRKKKTKKNPKSPSRFDLSIKPKAKLRKSMPSNSKPKKPKAKPKEEVGYTSKCSFKRSKRPSTSPSR
eukprot:CAMPEP_0197002488 /NCGR_PEP_ID=MMETSP1380-20130617/6982_1 /TAXON_ID=5936 /ORGANISM="Euplotes crassus, Strain CT5" /LENGTH=237 /DNA_ID=CAMNT_0042420639 /DNA_START=33 /DNA_END=747 /DNA_ORIENTATION=+